MMNLSLAELCNWNRPVHPSLPLASPFPYPSSPPSTLNCTASPQVLSYRRWRWRVLRLSVSSWDGRCLPQSWAVTPACNEWWERHPHKYRICRGLTCHSTCGTVELLMMGKMLNRIFLPRSCALSGAVHLGELRELFFQC